MTRVTRLIHNAGKYLLISIYPLPTHPTHNFTHKNGGNLDTLPDWPKKFNHNRPARCAGQWQQTSRSWDFLTAQHVFIFLHSGRRPTGAKRPSAGCPECICNRPRPWRRPCVSDWGCGAVILLSRGEFGREKNKIGYQRGCVWTFCYMPNL